MEVFYSGLQIVGNKAFFMTKRLALNTNEGFYRELKNVLKIRRAENVATLWLTTSARGGV